MFFASSPSTFSETGSALTYAPIFMKPALRLAHLQLPQKKCFTLADKGLVLYDTNHRPPKCVRSLSGSPIFHGSVV